DRRHPCLCKGDRTVPAAVVVSCGRKGINQGLYRSLSGFCQRENCMVAAINRGVVKLDDQEGNTLVAIFLEIWSHRNTGIVNIIVLQLMCFVIGVDPSGVGAVLSL